jgi:hypothetical protein
MHPPRPSAIFLRFTFFVFLLTSCSSTPPLPLTENPTLPAALLATDTMTPSTLPTPASATLPPATPATPRPKYTLYVTLDYRRKRLTVDETIVYANASGDTLRDLVLAVVPNLWEAVFNLTTLRVDGKTVSDYELDGQRLTIHLPAPLAADSTVKLSLAFELRLPELDPELNTRKIRPNIFGYTVHQMNLVNWYPFIVPCEAGEWLLHDAWYFGEHLVYDAADFEVNIKNADPNYAPILAASGPSEPNGEWTRYTLENGRSFALSASTEWRRTGAYAGDVFIVSYYYPLNELPAKAAAQAAADAIEVYTQRFGPYPHKTLAIVMSDFTDGAEFSAFFFLSKGFYNSYDNTSINYLTMISAHETAHQWWFEQVASDQYLEPWLDEALCTYSEHLFYERTDSPLVSRWWDFRVDSFAPQGYVDIPLNTPFDKDGYRQYVNAVYLRGARFLEELRVRMGDEAFFAFLQDYLAQMRGQIATSDDFFTILRQHTDADISNLLVEYFQESH